MNNGHMPRDGITTKQRIVARYAVQAKFHSQIGGIKEVQALSKGFNQIVLEEKDSAVNLIAISPCQVRNTWLFMRKWTHGFNPEQATQHDESMKNVTMLFPGLSYYWKLLSMMLDEELTLPDRLKKHIGPPSIHLLV